MSIPSEAAAVHRDAIVFDAHTDSLQRVLVSGDDLGQRTGGDPLVERGDFPRFREGGVNAQVFAVWVDTIFLPDHGVRRAFQQIDAFHRMLEANPDAVAFARGRDDVEAAVAGGKLAALLSIEGGDAIGGDLGILRIFHRLGASSMTLCHSRSTDWVDSSTDEPRWNGLSGFGVEVLREMNRLGMAIDVSHTSDAAVRQAIEVSRAPVIASHSNCRALCDHPRNLSDELLAAIAECGGVVGINFYSGFLDQAYRDLFLETYGDVFAGFNQPPTVPREELEDLARERLYQIGKDDLPRPPFETLLDQIDHAVEHAGIDHVGLGGDLDLPHMSTPAGLDDVTAYPLITAGLVDRGHSREDVVKILGENFLRVLADVQSAAEVS
ncbi:MAG: membrane dipeptidase [bacterium]|nr:membrane dipeptidase [bacterium]